MRAYAGVSVFELQSGLFNHFFHFSLLVHFAVAVCHAGEVQRRMYKRISCAFKLLIVREGFKNINKRVFFGIFGNSCQNRNYLLFCKTVEKLAHKNRARKLREFLSFIKNINCVKLAGL